MSVSTVTSGRSYQRWVVECAVWLLLAAMFLETWLVKGVVVPCRVVGGSMADSILGDHRNVICADCGYRFSCGVDQSPLPPRAVCPNCGYPDNDFQSPADVAGERLPIDRATFQLRPPRRWEVAALRQPTQADRIVLKRIVGLPGESIEIRDGDVYVDGQIQRKDLDQQRAMAIPVYDAAFRPALEKDFPPRWRPEKPNSRWKWEAGRFTHSGDAADESIDWLVYHHGRRVNIGGQSPLSSFATIGKGDPSSTTKGTVPSPTFVDSPVTDLYGYNQSRPRPRRTFTPWPT